MSYNNKMKAIRWYILSALALIGLSMTSYLAPLDPAATPEITSS